MNEVIVLDDSDEEEEGNKPKNGQVVQDLTNDDVVYIGETNDNQNNNNKNDDKIKDEDMNLLCTLGFPNDQVRNALLLCNGSKEAAAAYLFDGVLPNENVNNGGSNSNNNNNNNQNNNDDMMMMMMLQQEQFQLPNNNNNNNNGNNNNVNNLLMFLLEDQDFYEACHHANRHDRDTSSKAVLEALMRLGKRNPEFMQIIAQNPLQLIDLVSSIEF
tara:strand:+ start:29 stop:673 length:645 start_codon:yes stop_codon:yes gene_type:complete